MLPAYWALGFQLCRYGYLNLGEAQTAINRTMQAGIPLDVVYFDIDYMDHHEDFTIGPVGIFMPAINTLDLEYFWISLSPTKRQFNFLSPKYTFQPFAGLPQYAKLLHDLGLHVTLITDPAIEVDYDPFQRGINSVIDDQIIEIRFILPF
jgi:alpha-glucosidase (family GH31 glycosyl hydrolase)